MANPTYPGVYVEEVSSGVRPIAVASTSTAAFVGVTERGTTEKPKRVTSWGEYVKEYGGFIEGSRLAESVYMFFNNGGSQCYILRVCKAGAETASVTVKNRDGSVTNPSLAVSAKNEGAWGNELYVEITASSKDPEDRFKLIIWKQARPELIPKKAHHELGSGEFQGDVKLEEYNNLSMNPLSPDYAPKVINGRSNYLTLTDPFGEVGEGGSVVYSESLQQGTLRGGEGIDIPAEGLGANVCFRINLDNDGWKDVSLTELDEELGILDAVVKKINDTVTHLTSSSTDNATAYSEFACVKQNAGTEAEPLYYLEFKSGTNKAGEDGIAHPSFKSSVRIAKPVDQSTDATGILKLTPDVTTISDSCALRRPAVTEAVAVGDALVVAGGIILNSHAGGNGEDEPQGAEIDAALDKFDTIDDFSLLVIPGRGQDVIDVGLSYCENRPLKDVFFIGEAQDTDVIKEVQDLRLGITNPNSYGAIYYPWIMADDPSGREPEPVALPPSGFIAGLYARVDGSRGVWKAPAGTEARIRGAKALSYNMNDVENGVLNDDQIACIRQFPGAGIVSWGARTITSDPEYNYIPVRRTAIMLRVSIYRGIQWAVFEPNNEDLWAQLRMNLRAFMMTLFRRGAFKGTTPQEAFFVKCDSETTTPEDINLGIVNVLVGFAPLKPAEFVIVKISQKAAIPS